MLSSIVLVFPQSVLATNTLQGLSKGILEKSWLSSGTNRFADAKKGSGRDQRGAEHPPSRTKVEAALAQNVSSSPVQTHLSLLVLLEAKPLWKPSLLCSFPSPKGVSWWSREVKAPLQPRGTLPSWNCVRWDHVWLHQDWVTWQQIPCP